MSKKGVAIGRRLLGSISGASRGDGLLLPAYGLVNVRFKTFGAFWLDERVGFATGIPKSEVLEHLRGQRVGRSTVVAFVDYIVRELLWASIAWMAAPDQYVCVDRRGCKIRVPMPIEHNNFGTKQWLWPVDSFPNRLAIPLADCESLWAERTHKAREGERRDGWEHREYERHLEHRRAISAVEGQAELFTS